MINFLKKLFGMNAPVEPEMPEGTADLKVPEKEQNSSAEKPSPPKKPKTKTNEELEVLLKGLAYDDWEFRHEIGVKLGKIGSSAVEPLLDIVQDVEKGIEERKSAVFALGEIGDKKAVKVLIAIIDDYYPNGGDRFEQREQNRIRQRLTEDMHCGLARETEDALLKLGFQLNFD